MDIKAITKIYGAMQNKANPLDSKDTQILIACINAQARIESSKIVADAIDRQGRNIAKVIGAKKILNINKGLIEIAGAIRCYARRQ